MRSLKAAQPLLVLAGRQLCVLLASVSAVAFGTPVYSWGVLGAGCVCAGACRWGLPGPVRAWLCCMVAGQQYQAFTPFGSSFEDFCCYLV